MCSFEHVLKMIDEEDVEFIRLQFTDVWGNLKNLAITPGQLERANSNRFFFEGSAVFDNLYDYPDDLYLVPDPDTFVILPWRPQQGKVAKMICDICHEDGTPFDLSPRTILKKAVLKAEKELGVTFKVNPECEFFLFHMDENGTPTTVSHESAGYLDVGPIDMGENARRDMVLTLEDMGFEIQSSHHEKAPAQHEIDFTEGKCLETADAVMTFRFAVRSIAKRFGLYATFMPKPREGVAGSGMHLNFTMLSDGRNLFEKENGEISEEAKYFIGGIMAHAKGICAITNPVVNSYKRIVSGFEAPGKINWSLNGIDSLVRLHKCQENTRIELRFPDSAANPYLAIAVCLAAGVDGILNKIDPDTLTPDGVEKLPENLSDAVALMVRDSLVTETLGEEFVKIYEAVKKNEWKEYMTQVSDWEINKYLSKM